MHGLEATELLSSEQIHSTVKQEMLHWSIFCKELKRNLAIHHNEAATEFLSGMSLLFPCSTRLPPCPLPLPPDLGSPLLFSLSRLFAQLLPQLAGG